MEQLMQTLFGPLNKTYCNYFYFLEIMSFITFFVALFMIIKAYNSGSKYTPFYSGLAGSSIVGYFVNRLMYSICIKSLV